METKRQKAAKRFYYIKKLLNNSMDSASYCDGFYFKDKALNYAKKLIKPFHMNEYYDVTLCDLLLAIRDYSNLKEYKKALFMDYKAYYADSIYENMLYLLGA